jgi:ubiquinol-cytochrome c reductase cytochrome b subunit
MVGADLQELLRGGPQMGTLTVSRFFVLHVFILPGLLMAFIAAHIFVFRKAGAAGPIEEDPLYPKLPAQKFYPRQLVMDMVASLLIVLALALAAYFVPIHLGPEATPSDTSYIPRPEWYYLPMFQWLKMVGGRWSLLGGIVLPDFSRCCLPQFLFLIVGASAGHGGVLLWLLDLLCLWLAMPASAPSVITTTQAM